MSQTYQAQFYKSYIQPHIDFCNIVWDSSSEANKLKVFRLQKRACRAILDFNVENSIEATSSLKMLSIYEHLFLRKTKFMFKVYNNITPEYITENVKLHNSRDTSIMLRSSSAGCFIPPKPRTEYFKVVICGKYKNLNKITKI